MEVLEPTATDHFFAARTHDPNCPMRDVLDRVGDQWSLLVIASLEEGTLRFGQLQRRIGDISPRVLTHTLRHLEQDGLVARKVFPTSPPRVDYSLTDLGRSLHATMQGLVHWATSNHQQIREARQRYADATAEAI